MPRRRPAAIRAELPLHPRSPGPLWPSLSILPLSIYRQVRAIEKKKLDKDAVERALGAWKQHARCAPYASPEFMMLEVGHTWADPPYTRDVIEEAVRALPPRAAGVLAAAVRPIDRMAFARTLPDPFADPGGPWWHRRLWIR